MRSHALGNRLAVGGSRGLRPLRSGATWTDGSWAGRIKFSLSMAASAGAARGTTVASAVRCRRGRSPALAAGVTVAAVAWARHQAG